jgi:hypothetical protein
MSQKASLAFGVVDEQSNRGRQAFRLMLRTAVVRAHRRMQEVELLGKVSLQVLHRLSLAYACDVHMLCGPDGGERTTVAGVTVIGGVEQPGLW